MSQRAAGTLALPWPTTSPRTAKKRVPMDHTLLIITMVLALVGLVIDSHGQGLDITAAALDVAKLVALPFIIGQALRPWLTSVSQPSAIASRSLMRS